MGLGACSPYVLLTRAGRYALLIFCVIPRHDGWGIRVGFDANLTHLARELRYLELVEWGGKTLKG
jgi:hypothetical protein